MNGSPRRYIYLAVVLTGAALMAIVVARRADRVDLGRSSEPEPAPALTSSVEPPLPTTFDELYSVGLAELEAAQSNLVIRRLLRAGEAMEQALALDSTNVDALKAMGKIRNMEWRFKEAIRYFDLLLWERPLRADVWGLIGDAWLAQGHYRSADSCYHMMMSIDTGFESLLRGARASFELTDLDSALTLVDRAIVLGPGSDVPPTDLARGYVVRADMLMARGFWEEARRDVNTAGSLAPDVLEIQKADAALLILEGKLTEARKAYEAIVARSPHPTFKSDLARVYLRLGDAAKADSLVAVAARDFDSLGRTFPDRIQREQAEFLVDWGLEIERATKMSYRVSRNRRDFYTYELLARAYHASGQYDLAWSSIALALRNKPKHPRLYHTAALMAKAAGKLDQYEIYAALALEFNPRAEEQYGPL